MTTETKPRMTVTEVALLREIVRWRRNNGITFDYLFTAYQHPDGRAVSWIVGDSGYRPCVGVARTFSDSYEPFSWHDVATVTEAVDLLVALGYLPVRFSWAYRQGWDAVLLLATLEQAGPVDHLVKDVEPAVPSMLFTEDQS